MIPQLNGLDLPQAAPAIDPQRTARAAPLFHGSCGNHELYGLNCDDYTALRQESNGMCYLCGSRHPWMNIDHDHLLGMRAVRGLLCPRCNAGHMRRIDWGERAIDDRTRRYLLSPWHLQRQGLSPAYDVRIRVALSWLSEADQAEIQRLANPSGHSHYSVLMAKPRFEHQGLAARVVAGDIRPVMRLIWMIKRGRFHTDIAASIGPRPPWA